uniref:Vomeronasal type-1 receptor n=1 Tax=Panagrolaimus davidi TaxID=227884 RepID=A0A914QIJ2_9BILA
MFIFVNIAIPFHVLPGFPITPETICRSFGCLAPNSAGAIYSIFRYVTSAANVFISLILVKLVKKQTSLHSKNSKYTRLTLITVLMTVLLDFFPHLIAFSLNTFWEINLTKLIGPYSLLVSSMNSGICAIIYYNTWRKLSRNTVSHLSPSAIVVVSHERRGRTFS